MVWFVGPRKKKHTDKQSIGSVSPQTNIPQSDMPPIAPAYTWSQDADAVTISVPLKGAKGALVDLFGE